LADLAREIGSDEKRLGKMIVRINTIESTSPLSCGDSIDESQLPAVLVPAEPERPDYAYEKTEVRDRVRDAIEALPPRERRVIALYYYGEVTMKEIGSELGVNESRVSQLHARALGRLRQSLGSETSPAEALQSIRAALLTFTHKPKMAKAEIRLQAPNSRPQAPGANQAPTTSNVVDYASRSRAALSKSPSRNGLASQGQPVSSRNRSASVPTTAPVTKMTRRVNAGVAAAMAR
jgi:RNA polymerase sigma factor for flagellar operon FliA